MEQNNPKNTAQSTADQAREIVLTTEEQKRAAELIETMKSFRSRYANDFREGFSCGMPEAMRVTYSLYEITSLVTLSLEIAQANNGKVTDKMPLLVVKRKLEKLTKSEEFKDLDDLYEIGLCTCVTNRVKTNIRMMLGWIRDILGPLDNKENRKILDDLGF